MDVSLTAEPGRTTGTRPSKRLRREGKVPGVVYGMGTEPTSITVEWPEQLSPSVTVAKLRFPQQDISGEDNVEKMDGLSFSPWRVTAEHRPLGNTMRSRKEVYRRSSIVRHKLNNQERREPRTTDEILPS